MADHTPAYLRTHTIAGDALTYSLADPMEVLTGKVEPGGRQAITLLKQHGTSVVLMAMDKGNLIEEHGTPGVVTIQVLKGRVDITGDDRTINAEPGTLLAFGPSVAHSLSAIDEAAVLLTISPPA